MGITVQSFISRHLIASILLALVACGTAAQGSVLNWPLNAWTQGAPAPGQTFSQSFTAVDPNDVSLSINNNGASGTGATWNTNYPQISTSPLTGGLSGVQGVQLYVSAEASTSAYVKVTVSFANPVINLSFQIWDVDANAGQFVDKITNIQGLTESSTTVGATSVTSVTPGFNTVTGSGLTTVVTGTANAANNTNNGSIDVSFSGPITQFSFQWSNSDAGLGPQAIGLGPLSFTFVPEMSAGWFVALVCALALMSSEISRRARSTTR